MGDSKACDECQQKCSLIHGKKTDPSPLVTTFTKILFGGYDISKNLFLPQKTSQAIPGLVAGENCSLQDTNGQRWEVKLGAQDDRLALTEGWNRFYEDHGLKVGYVLSFHYIIGSHFVVEIFDKTGFEKLKFPVTNGKKRKRRESYGNCNAVEECQNRSNHSTKKNSAAISGTSDSKARTHSQPMSKDKPLSLESENGKYQNIASANCDADPFYMINRDDVSHHEEDRTSFLNLVNSEMKSGVDPDGISDKRFHPSNTLTESDAVVGNVDEKSVSAKVVNGEIPAEVAASTLSNNNNATPERENVAEVENDYRRGKQVDSDYRNKSPTVSSKKVIEEAASNKKHLRKHPKFNKRSGRTFGGVENNNEVPRVMKTEPVDSINDDSLDASAFNFPAIVGSHELLVLPTSVTLWVFTEKKVVYLRDQDGRVWPVLYHNKHGIQALTSGWKHFFMSCRLQIGDECDFTLEDKAETIFRVDVNRK